MTPRNNPLTTVWRKPSEQERKISTRYSPHSFFVLVAVFHARRKRITEPKLIFQRFFSCPFSWHRSKGIFSIRKEIETHKNVILTKCVSWRNHLKKPDCHSVTLGGKEERLTGLGRGKRCSISFNRQLAAKKDFVAIEEINPSLHFDSHPQEMERKQENPVCLQILSNMLQHSIISYWDKTSLFLLTRGKTFGQREVCNNRMKILIKQDKNGGRINERKDCLECLVKD